MALGSMSRVGVVPPYLGGQGGASLLYVDSQGCASLHNGQLEKCSHKDR